MLERVRGADRAGLQVLIHAIGDRANDKSFRFTSKSKRKTEIAIDASHRACTASASLGHSAICRDKVIASMQPYHAIDDGRWAEKRIGQNARRRPMRFDRYWIPARPSRSERLDVAPLNPI